MSFWKRMNIKWDKDSISTWSSPRKTLYILFPLLVYFLAHDMAEVLLWAGLNLFMENSGETVAAFLQQNAYTVRGIIYGIAICLGVAAIGQGVLAEIDGRPVTFDGEGEPVKKKQPFLTVETSWQVKNICFWVRWHFCRHLGLTFYLALPGLREAHRLFPGLSRHSLA